jgi:hypothetical protein
MVNPETQAQLRELRKGGIAPVVPKV